MQTAEECNKEKAPSNLISTTEACEYIGRSRAWLDRKWRDPDDPSFDENFPKPYRLSSRANSFSIRELDVWLLSVRVKTGVTA